MNSNAQILSQKAITWLAVDVLPLWSKHGIDPRNGGFYECLSNLGLPFEGPRRALVQSRQIYAFTEALNMQLMSRSEVQKIVQQGTAFLIKNYQLSSGAFIQSVDADENPYETQNELYTQAFVLFSLARSFGVLKDIEIKYIAKKLLNYLKKNRKNISGGYTEIKTGATVFQSNPHMHLFEAALEWIKVDPDSDWMTLASELYQLSTQQFIQTRTKNILAEHFDQDWKPLLLNNPQSAVFIFEPGHHYEWAWLYKQYQSLTGVDAGIIPQQLFDLAEQYGVNRKTNLAVDEVSSDLKIQKASSRFWPQCERIKAAVELGLSAPVAQQINYARVSDEAMTSLFQYFETIHKGLWYDTVTETGDFIPQAAKASSLYHIINAISEYSLKRPRLQDLIP